MKPLSDEQAGRIVECPEASALADRENALREVPHAVSYPAWDSFVPPLPVPRPRPLALAGFLGDVEDEE